MSNKRQVSSEYIFTSFDLSFFDLRDHVEKMSTQGSPTGSHTYRFNQKGQLVEIDGYDPFSSSAGDASVRMERDRSGFLKPSDDAAPSADAYQYLEYDAHGNWTKRKLKQGGEGAEETRTITYF